MKRAIPVCLALLLTLSACSRGREMQTEKSPEELAAAYTQAIEAARDEELNSAFPVTTNTSQTDPADQEMTFALLGFAPEDVEAYAVSLSLMNVRAYAIVAAKPAQGKEETVKKGLENYVEAQKSSFEFYLEDQFDVAASAKLEELSDGTCLLVTSEDQDEIFEEIKSALEG